MRQEKYPGYYTAQEVQRHLGITEGTMYSYIRNGALKRHNPPGKRYGVYKVDEVEAFAASRQAFAKSPPRASTSIWELASEDDMPAIVEISRAIFNTDGSTPISAATRLAWLRKNPETFWVLRDATARIVGYASILPLSKNVIDQFIRDEIAAEDITAGDVQTFEPGGKPLHLYIMAIGIDPREPVSKKHEYGACLIRGLFAFLLDLAGRGVQIATITARSHKPDGLRLLRKLGIPQLRSTVPGKSLFAVTLAESGMPIFERYSAILEQARQSQHQPEKNRATATRATHTRGSEPKSTLPDGLAVWRMFARLHGIGESTLQAAIEARRITIVEGSWVVGRATVKGALDAAGRSRFYELYHSHERFTACPDCPHET